MVEIQQDYEQFIAAKRTTVPAAGISATASDVHPTLFPFQRDLVLWALRKGRCALFADTGLGKTFMQLEWARLVGQRTLIIAPLTVARQTVREGEKVGVTVQYARHQAEVTEPLVITNYEMVQHFDARHFSAVVLDESSILKALAGKTRRMLTEMFSDTPYRLCCTATPAPNDRAEIGNHAEFLGVMTRADMLAAFFVHDDEGWRLKGHARGPFFRWLASWAMSIRMPSDLGYDDDGFVLPPLDIQPHFVPAGAPPVGALFFTGLKGIRDRLSMRRQTIKARCEAAAAIVDGHGEQWLVWCGLNDESKLLTSMLPDAVEVRGDQDTETKIRHIQGFQDGKVRVLVTKPKIAGFGMNFQNCANMVFVGLSDSWESYYQCIRRCYRFGQKRPVRVFISLSDNEAEIYENVRRKEVVAAEMCGELILHVQAFEEEELGMKAAQQSIYEAKTELADDYTIMLGDSAERVAEWAPESVGLSVFSPPFLSLYTYSPTERDVGNSRTVAEFYDHMRFISRGLLAATMPGRHACVHVAQVPAMMVRDGYIGMKDFRGKTIEHFEASGWIYHGEVCIDKDPQAQAIRTKSKALLFAQLRKDASWLRPALADYILVFRKPGENAVPIHPDINNEQWIQWARPIWYGIRESDTLNVAEGREDDDERHICPLQLETIERCVKLWSNTGEVVADPFAGIGSTGYVALLNGRRFTGCELKESYFTAMRRNLGRAMQKRNKGNLFANAPADGDEGAETAIR